ncbi:hypothetical protein ABGB14_12410 [Nonomuraea sp. B10E15]|uniref:hypothetical protein n=1 Tax=Nonomuraea sp. B10E15 TaxID=3153560 RepID=UPI00325C4B7D
MEAEVDLDHAQFGRSTEGLVNVGQQASALAQAFVEDVKSYGQPWGTNNALGQTIGMCYETALGLIEECTRSNLDDYHGYPQGLQFMTAQYQSAEAESASAIDSVRV